MPEANLKQHFDNILKLTIAPALKEMGFKKKGQHFSRQVNDIYQCFNVQKSKWNSYNESLSFTFNIGFYSELLNNILRGNEIQTDFPNTTDCFIQGRLGSISHSRDHWYELSNRMKFELVNANVKNDIERYLITLFNKHNSLENLKELVLKNAENRTFLISPISQFVFLMTTKEIEFAVEELKKEYKNALRPQSTTQTINYPDGRSKVYTSKPYINQSFIDSIEKYAKYYNIEL
jgi:hypothetical protein